MKKPQRGPTGYNRRRAAQKRFRKSPLYREFGKERFSKKVVRELLVGGWGEKTPINASWIITIKHAGLVTDTLTFEEPAFIGKSYTVDGSTEYIPQRATNILWPPEDATCSRPQPVN